MGSAAQMRQLTQTAQKELAASNKRDNDVLARLRETVDAEVRASIQKDFEDKWFPKIEEAAREGKGSVTLCLGCPTSWRSGEVETEFQIRQRATTDCLRDLLGREGYKVAVSHPLVRHADDDPGNEEIHMEVSW